jgi:hypothetical protein
MRSVKSDSCFLRLPETAGDLESEDEAIDESYEMAEAVFDYINANPTLSGAADLALFPEDEQNCKFGMASFGATRYGATYLFGIINP